MGTKVITVWLILLTAWVGFNDISEYMNLQVRIRATEIRKQKFENIDASLKSLEQFVNGPLRDKVNEVAKNSHKH